MVCESKWHSRTSGLTGGTLILLAIYFAKFLHNSSEKLSANLHSDRYVQLAAILKFENLPYFIWDDFALLHSDTVPCANHSA